jgi:hypothetical protein
MWWGYVPGLSDRVTVEVRYTEALPCPRRHEIKLVLPFFFTVVKLTDFDKRTALGFAVQVAVTQ